MLKRLPLVLATAAALVLARSRGDRCRRDRRRQGRNDSAGGHARVGERLHPGGHHAVDVVGRWRRHDHRGLHRVGGADVLVRGRDDGLRVLRVLEAGRSARESDTLDDYAYQGLLNPEYEKYATDQTGYWYDPTCQFDAPASTRGPYILRESIYVPAGTPPPVAQVEIDPEVLARAARDAMELPQGELRWNPSLDGTGATVVNAETWVWLDGGATVFVRAEIPNVLAATVTANMTGLTLEGDGAGVTRCDGPGTPWTAGAGNPTCSLTFTRSSADGTTSLLPTSTLTATQNWTASWSTDADPTPREIEGDTVTTTAELPVAEIQSIVTRR